MDAERHRAVALEILTIINGLGEYSGASFAVARGLDRSQYGGTHITEEVSWLCTIHSSHALESNIRKPIDLVCRQVPQSPFYRSRRINTLKALLIQNQGGPVTFEDAPHLDALRVGRFFLDLGHLRYRTWTGAGHSCEDIPVRFFEADPVSISFMERDPPFAQC